MNANGSKTLTTFIPFHTDCDYGADYQINNYEFLCAVLPHYTLAIVRDL